MHVLVLYKNQIISLPRAAINGNNHLGTNKPEQQSYSFKYLRKIFLAAFSSGPHTKEHFAHL